MFSYTKSLIAIALALLAVMGAGLWCQRNALEVQNLTRERDVIKIQLSGSQANATLLADYEKRLETLDRDLKAMTRKFVSRDYESPQLVKAVVKAASAAGMEMTDASKQERKSDALPVRGQGQKASVISHDITLKGSYTGLVKFMQSLAAWAMGYRLESIEIAPPQDEKPVAGEIEVMLMLSVFSLEKIPGT